MQTLIINISEKKSALVKKLLKELGVTIETQKKGKGINIPNRLTAKTIEDAHKGIGLEKPIENINDFLKSL